MFYLIYLRHSRLAPPWCLIARLLGFGRCNYRGVCYFCRTMFVSIFSVCCLMKVSKPDIRTQIIIIVASIFSFRTALLDL